jgi:hypothetical protein
LTFESDATDDVGQGQSQSVTITGAQFELTSNTASGTLRFNTPFGANPRLNLDLAAPTGQPLAPGYYPLAQSFASVPAAGVAGVGFRYNGRSCNTLTGRLLVQEAVYGPGDTVVRFHARFEQHCNGASAGLRGTIWIDAQGSTSPPALAPFPASDAGTTSFSYQSEAGDVIGGGGSGSFTLASATFTPTTSGPEIAVTIRPVPTGTIWTLQFRGPTGAQLLAGTYDPSIDPLQAGTANLRVTGPGFCTGVPLTGKFTVLEAAYGSPGTVLRFRATFEVRCGTATATLRGEVRILADPWR